MLDIYVDADACPVKEEVYRVARRHHLKVILVANAWMRTPHEEWLTLVVVEKQFDQADDWIVERIGKDDIVITADVPLASRCLKKNARAIGPTGREFTEETIGEALATRDLLAELRDLGEVTRGPAPFGKRDRSRFLHQLDETIRSVRRRK